MRYWEVPKYYVNATISYHCWTRQVPSLWQHFTGPELNIAKALPGWMYFTLAPVESQWVWKPKSGLLLGLRVRLTLMSLWSTCKNTHKHADIYTCTTGKGDTLWSSVVCFLVEIRDFRGLLHKHSKGYVTWTTYYLQCRAIITAALQQMSSL